MNVPPWVTYAAQLTPIGYGYPLWVPDPPPGRGAIQLGDVGWIHEGEFLPLFNALRAADDSQPRNAVPMNFIPLDIATLVFEGPREKIGQKVLCSSSILRRDFSGGIDLQVNVPGSLPYPSGSVELAFSCEDDSGALLMPHPCVVTHDIHSRRIMDQYMEVNFESWLEFAYNLGLDLREEDIRFVCGTKKTARWAVAAFQGNYRNKSGTLSGALGAVGSAHFSLSISNQALPANHYRVGPPGAQLQYSQPWAEPYDQCVFINTLRRKKRRLPSFLRFLRAGAGPHSLPDNSGDPGEPGSSMCTTGRGTSSDGSSESYTYSDSTPFKVCPWHTIL
ncbi:hypothetical protein C8Q78DRAFT_969416 [Trametes maxima]|nr:hypothetical protein C8Q78DRAFT_969416 [Trametes maxima]